MAIPPGTLAFRLTLGCLLAVPVSIAIVGFLPRGWRGAGLLVSMSAVAASGIAGGLIGRRALQEGTPHTGRTIVVSIVGLTIGVTAGLSVILALGSLVT